MDKFWTHATLSWKTEAEHKESMEKLTRATRSLIHNVTSVVAITALVNGSTKIMPVHVQGAIGYLKNKCNIRILHQQQTGGAGIPYVTGIDQSMYASQNAGPESAETINFDTLLARFGLSVHGAGLAPGFMEGGTGPQKQKSTQISLVWIDREIKAVRDRYRMRISKTAQADILHLIKQYMACFMEDLEKEKPLTKKKVKTLLEKKRYRIFH